MKNAVLRALQLAVGYGTRGGALLASTATLLYPPQLNVIR
jgi:hypothetical protein